MKVFKPDLTVKRTCLLQSQLNLPVCGRGTEIHKQLKEFDECPSGNVICRLFLIE